LRQLETQESCETLERTRGMASTEHTAGASAADRQSQAPTEDGAMLDLRSLVEHAWDLRTQVQGILEPQAKTLASDAARYVRAGLKSTLRSGFEGDDSPAQATGRSAHSSSLAPTASSENLRATRLRPMSPQHPVPTRWATMQDAAACGRGSVRLSIGARSSSGPSPPRL